VLASLRAPPLRGHSVVVICLDRTDLTHKGLPRTHSVPWSNSGFFLPLCHANNEFLLYIDITRHNSYIYGRRDREDSRRDPK
jgi:hypothetical protein